MASMTTTQTTDTPPITEEQVAVIAGHILTPGIGSFSSPEGDGNSRECSCGERLTVLHSEMGEDDDVHPYLNRRSAEHIRLKLEGK